MYEFNGIIYLQQEGSPMGLRASWPLSRLFMDHWVQVMRQLEERCNSLAVINPVRYERLDIVFLSKYEDDVVSMLRRLKPGTRWSPMEKAMVWEPGEGHE